MKRKTLVNITANLDRSAYHIAKGATIEIVMVTSSFVYFKHGSTDRLEMPLDIFIHFTCPVD